jgi:hypothetical protein
LAHSFNGEFNLHVSMTPGKPSLALFKAGAPGTDTFCCGPLGHYELGTLVVEP